MILKLLIDDPNAYEVDHIIPISISLDDSITNKVLVTHRENQEKGNLTPISAFVKGRFTKGSLAQYKAYCLKLKEKNIPVIFEKESINTMEGSGELLLTILKQPGTGRKPKYQRKLSLGVL